MAEDSVLDLLDSLGSTGAKTRPKKSSSKKREAQRTVESKDTSVNETNDIKEAEQNKDGAGVSKTDSKSAEVSEQVPEQVPEKASGNSPENSSEKASENGSEKVPEQSVSELASSSDSSKPVESNSKGAPDPVAAISSWWSRNKTDLWSKAQETLSDAVGETVRQAKQAESIVREEQANFNFSALQSRLTSVLHTIVPPISEHEQLRVHIFHDMVGWPVVDEIVFDVFDYVMDQIEGSSKLNLVVQKGHERHLAGSEKVAQRKLNVVECTLADGVKLARASIEEIARANSKNEGTGEEVSNSKTSEQSSEQSSEKSSEREAEEDDDVIKQSELYVSLQPVVTKSNIDSAAAISHDSDSLYFVACLADFQNNIEISTASQPLPAEWAEWLDTNGAFKDKAIDPRKWVTGWVEDSISLVIGVIVQKYVTKRMGLV